MSTRPGYCQDRPTRPDRQTHGFFFDPGLLWSPVTSHSTRTAGPHRSLHKALAGSPRTRLVHAGSRRRELVQCSYSRQGNLFKPGRGKHNVQGDRAGGRVDRGGWSGGKTKVRKGKSRAEQQSPRSVAPGFAPMRPCGSLRSHKSSRAPALPRIPSARSQLTLGGVKGASAQRAVCIVSRSSSLFASSFRISREKIK